ncbi:PAAR domain-containing protein [Duganella sp. CF517]|uniref:PAAR domain-containing protein n=1 Tax=Duganella sp. CF517 TaxID=1881038 RepID=UPI001E438738|nr:PAAR domain-containing protein [Duganella sp. CF517]
MGERAIIRQGDRTSHWGTVLEGHLFLIIHGKPAAGVGHKVHCPSAPARSSSLKARQPQP